MEPNSLNACMEEWETLSNEYRSLEKLNKVYQAKLEEVNSLQQKCIKGIAHQRYRLNIIKTSLKKLEKYQDDLDAEEKERNCLLQTDLIRRKAQLYEMENILPKSSGVYLKIILGNINVSILDKNEKFRYKDEYEKFKLVMSLLALAVSLINCLSNIRTLDLIHMFLLVWYYCTLTIRESILKVNGSRMKGWWRAHHFISTVLAGVMLIWPVGECYNAFRTQFMAFNVYISIVQYLQFMYQRGCLYRLKALGQRHNMDITVDGFQSWMFKGLSFLLPFLFLGYLWELYHSYVLYQLISHPSADWHVSTLCVLFFILFLGNTITTAAVIPQKLRERFKLKYRFTRLDKYIWNHKHRRVSFRNPETSDRRTPAARAASFNRKRPNVEQDTIIESGTPKIVPAKEECSGVVDSEKIEADVPVRELKVESNGEVGYTDSTEEDDSDVSKLQSKVAGDQLLVKAKTSDISETDSDKMEEITDKEAKQLSVDALESNVEETSQSKKDK